MASFKDNTDDYKRLDYSLLRNGSVNLYFKRAVLAEDLQWLRANNYSIVEFDCSTWNSEDELHEAFFRGLSFPGYYGHNLNALNDCLCGVEIPSESGLSLVFHRIDLFTRTHSRVVQDMFDILEKNSRTHLLFGKRLITLALSDDPSIEFEPVGSMAVHWNSREWLNKDRGLQG